MERGSAQKLRFHVERSIFHAERWRSLYCTVEIFMLNGRDFHVEWSRYLRSTVTFFMMNNPDFHDDWSRISC